MILDFRFWIEEDFQISLISFDAEQSRGPAAPSIQNPKSKIEYPQEKIAMSQPENQKINDAPYYGVPNSESRYEAAPAQEPAQISEAGRFVGMLFSPGETFEDINRKPTWVVPLIIAIVMALAFTWFLNWYFAAGMEEFMRKTIADRAAQSGRPAPTSRDMEFGLKITRWVGFAIALVGPVVANLVIAGVFALGMMIMQAQTTFKKIFSVVLWSGVATGAVQIIVIIASVLVRGSDSVGGFNPRNLGSLSATNLAAFLPADTSASVKALASSIDVFSIWFLILLIIGLTTISGSRKISRGSMAGLVIGLWIVTVLAKMGWAAIFG